jgi:hypothetical protein
MRIQHLIYRIELPSTTEEEKRQVEELKEVLGKILLYEKTPCPFRRGFTIDLPEEQETTPPRRRTIVPMSKAKKWEMKDIWRREGEEHRPSRSQMNSPEDSEDEQVPLEKQDEEQESFEKENISISSGLDQPEEEAEHNTQRDTKPPIRPRDMNSTTSRSSAAPTTDLEKLPDLEELALEEEAEGHQPPQEIALELPTDDRSRASSIRSFYTSLDIPVADPPSPDSDYHDPTNTIPLYTHIITKVPSPDSTHSRDVSEVTITSLSSPTETISTPISASHPPSLSSNSTSSPATDASTASYKRPQPRTRTSMHTTNRSTSLTYATRARTNLNSSLISRTFSLLSGPPSGLVSVMMTIASRIANGALSSPDNTSAGAAYRYDLKGLPGRWEDSEEEREFDHSDENSEAYALRRLNLADDEDDDFEDLEDEVEVEVEAGQGDEEDDFGVPLGNDTPARKGRKNWGWVRSPKASPVKTRKIVSRHDELDHQEEKTLARQDDDEEDKVD